MVDTTHDDSSTLNTPSGSTDPLVSVCIPTFNGELTIAESIRSVLSQTFANFELIVSDDNSTDRTLSIANGFSDPRIRIINGPASGTASDNWNQSVSVARGEFVKVMGQDDVLYENSLEFEVQALQKNSHLSPIMTICRRDLISPTGKRLPRVLSLGHRFQNVLRLLDILPSIVRSGRNPLGEPVCVTFRRDALQGAGGFRGTYLIDLTTWVNLLKNGNGLFIRKRLCAFRVSRSSWSYVLRKKQAEQTRSYLHELVEEFPTEISRIDLALGSINSHLAQFVRALVLLLVARERKA